MTGVPAAQTVPPALVPAGDGGRRDHKDETRARILDTALELFAARGFAATSTREIAERLGFTKAALYYHFRTKDDLLGAIVAPAMDGLVDLVGAREGSPRPGAPLEVLEGYVDLVAAHAELIRVLADDPAARTCPALAPALPLYQRLVELLSGSDHPDAAQRTRVRAALGAVHAALVRGGHEDDPDVVRSTTLAAARGALGPDVADRPAGQATWGTPGAPPVAEGDAS